MQAEVIQTLKDEIAILKGEKAKPDIKPSRLGKKSVTDEQDGDKPVKRPGSQKRKKDLVVHRTKEIHPEDIPEGSRFKGYEKYYIQDMIFVPFNTCYKLARYVTPSGDSIIGKIPDGIAQDHFGIDLIRFILYQRYQARVTQQLILEQLLEIGIDISAGQVNRILTEGHDAFHAEKQEILIAGLEVSDYINVDDTGARHQGRNGYCTHIGNDMFAYFESTDSKSRINFLTVLRGKYTDYMLIPEAILYMQAQKMPRTILQALTDIGKKCFSTKEEWEKFLVDSEIIKSRHVKIVTEGALLGSVLEHGINKELVIVSDDAGQFNILLHALCWVHAERNIKKLIGFTDEQRHALESMRNQIWDFYDDLKAYKENPEQNRAEELKQRFDEIFSTQTCFASLNLALSKIRSNKSELLLVLQRPEIPLHNTGSENDIREYVTVRKISAGTRSDLGRKCRDTFTSHKKTCRKNDIPFWDYLGDRLSGLNIIPRLAT
ncbi:transposase [Desulfonatronum parangueonense]